MKPLFTIHGGEYLVACEIEHRFKAVNVWVPSRDTGVDLLLTDQQNRRTVSLQVKFSKDYLGTTMQDAVLLRGLRACGWWTIDRDKLQASRADYWVFVLLGFERRTTDFLIVPPGDFWQRLSDIHPQDAGRIQSYLWVAQKKKCWETRGLLREDQRGIALGEFHPTGRDAQRDLSEWLNNWEPVAELSK